MHKTHLKKALFLRFCLWEIIVQPFILLRLQVSIEVRPTENDSTQLYKNGDISVVTLRHYYRRFVTLIARRCKVKFFRNQFVFIFADIFNNDVD